MHDDTNQFVTAARNALSFLEREHGFAEHSVKSPEDADSAYATYVIVYARHDSKLSPQLVRLSYTPARGELYLECIANALSKQDHRCDVRELLAISIPDSTDPLASDDFDLFGRPEMMLERFETLAAALREFGGRFFAGDVTLWDEVRSVREMNRRKIDQDAQHRARQQTLHESELAFQAKDWQRVVDLLEGVDGTLTKAQSSRLSYAKSQCCG